MANKPMKTQIVLCNDPVLNKIDCINGLLIKCEVKMTGYCPKSFFCVFMDRNGVEVHKLTKKERGQYLAILTEKA